MDIIRLGREASKYVTQIGVGLGFIGGFFLVAYSLNPDLFQVQFEFVLTMLIISGSGFAFAFVGFVLLVLYYIEEFRFVRIMWKFLDEESPSQPADMISFSPAFLVDSIDREILEMISNNSGDLLAIKNQIKIRALLQDSKMIAERIANLVNIDMSILFEKRLNKRLYLTPMGHEVIHSPIASFTSRIPIRVRKHMYEARRQIWRGKWGQAILESHKAIEAAYKQLLRENAEIDDKIASILKKFEVEARPLEQKTAGALHNIMIGTSLLKKGSFERYLSDQITVMRASAHDSPEAKIFTSEDAIRCEQYLGILLRILFG